MDTARSGACRLIKHANRQGCCFQLARGWLVRYFVISRCWEINLRQLTLRRRLLILFFHKKNNGSVSAVQRRRMELEAKMENDIAAVYAWIKRVCPSRTSHHPMRPPLLVRTLVIPGRLHAGIICTNRSVWAFSHFYESRGTNRPTQISPTSEDALGIFSYLSALLQPVIADDKTIC